MSRKKSMTTVDQVTELSDEDILNLGNHLGGMFSDNQLECDISVPRLVVVGSQSAGKSTLINSIVGVDILPMGKNMVTRTPLHLQVIQDSSSMVEFGDYLNGVWSQSKKFELNEYDEIQKHIEIVTQEFAGNQKGISNREIMVRVRGPKLKNTSFVDLPGLTMVACTDKGQPSDIKEQIRNLIKSYITDRMSIILVVLPAREDLETDPALELVKECDPNSDRTVGALTKVDLMNTGSTIVPYLADQDISQNLRLKHGYFAIRNREQESMLLEEGLNREARFFGNNPIYRSCLKRTGIANLGQVLCQIIVENIKQNVP